MKHSENFENEHNKHSRDQSKSSQSTSKKKTTIAIISTCVAVLLIVAAFFLFFNTDESSRQDSSKSSIDIPVKVNPFDYTEVTFEGVNSHGEVTINYDCDALIEALIGECSSDADYETISSWLSQYLIYYDGIEFSCSQEDGLSNGDIVTVTFLVSDEASERVKEGSRQYTVSGLTEPTTIDVFDELTVTFNGTSGNAYAKIEMSSDEDWMKHCRFDISPNSQLCNGNLIVVTLSTDSQEYLLDYFGLIPTVTSKTYTVEGLSTYITTIEQLPINVVEQIAKRYYEEQLETLQPDKDYNYENITYSGTYFYVSDRTGYSWDAPYENILLVDISYELYVWGRAAGVRHSCLYFTNIMIYNDIVSLSYEDGVESIKTFDESYYDIILIPLTINAN